jgi:N-acyl-D-amino-acid deacylase
LDGKSLVDAAIRSWHAVQAENFTASHEITVVPSSSIAWKQTAFSVYDILIRGGVLFDGTGAAGAVGSVAINADRIVAVGDSVGDSARKIIDADGLAVAPGFIDIKTHSDFTLPINPKAESKVRQGVTTEIVGHCGFSVAPALLSKVELLKDYLSSSAP